MSGVKWSAVTGEVAMTATVAKTVLQILAATNHRATAEQLEVTFTGTIVATDRALVELIDQTTGGTMSVLTPVKINQGDNESLEVTATHTATVEPTAGDIPWKGGVPAQIGVLEQINYPIVGGRRLGIRITTTANMNCIVRIMGEE